MVQRCVNYKHLHAAARQCGCGLQVLQDQYMAVKLRHMPSAEALKPLVDVLGEEHWPPGSDFTIHVLVHLLHDYMSHSKQYVARCARNCSVFRLETRASFDLLQSSRSYSKSTQFGFDRSRANLSTACFAFALCSRLHDACGPYARQSHQTTYRQNAIDSVCKPGSVFQGKTGIGSRYAWA